MLRLWGKADSFNVRKVIWALDELGLDYSRIDAGRGVPRTAEFAIRNPNLMAPVIEDGEFVVWESNVIVRYLAARYGKGTLCPRELEARFAAEKWMDWQATTFWPALRPLHHAAQGHEGAALSDAAYAEALSEVFRWLIVLEDQLHETAYLAGDSFTMADIPVALTVERWLALADAGMRRPRVERWFDTLRARPGAATVLRGG